MALGPPPLEDPPRRRGELVLMKKRAIRLEPSKPAREPITVGIIEELMKLPKSGDSRAFTRLSGISDAGHDSIVFAQDEKALEAALASDAGLILAPLGS